MSAVSWSDAWGWHADQLSFQGSRFFKGETEFSTQYYGNPSLRKFATYIPLIGTIVSALEINAACHSLWEGCDQGYSAMVIFRGVPGLLSMGAVWLPVDLIATAALRREVFQLPVGCILDALMIHKYKGAYSPV